MRKIVKTHEPQALVRCKSTPNASYNSLSKADKDELKRHLLAEQGFLCAYCSKRIKIETMDIEHHIAQSNPTLINGVTKGKLHELDYQNLLAVCKGNADPNNLTCDKSRGSLELKVNPLVPSTLADIFYTKDGKIHSNNPDIDDDLNKKLNLNSQSNYLMSNRLNAFTNLLKKVPQNGGWNESDITTIKKFLLNPDSNGELPPFTDYALYKINKKYHIL